MRVCTKHCTMSGTTLEREKTLAFDAAKEAELLEEFFARKERIAAPALRLAEGETVVVDVTDISWFTEGDYDPYPVLTVLDHLDKKSKTFHAFHTLVKQRLKELNVQKGTRLYLSYAGERVKNKATEEERKMERDRYHMYVIETPESLAAAKQEEKPFAW